MTIEVKGLCPLIQVFDMPKSVAFYRDVLGFEVVDSSGPGDDFDWGLLQLGPAQVMLNTAYEKEDRPSEPERERFAGHGDTVLFFGCDDLDALYEHLTSRGVDVKRPKTAPYGMRQLALDDPDGYGLCFQHPA